MPAQCVCHVASTADVGVARRHAVRIASTTALDETARGRVAVIATELATNLALHAGGGQLLVQCLTCADGDALEILSIDAGAGMADPEKCLRDGYSSGGTHGNGLGAVKRLSDEFDLFSQTNKGTAIVSRVHSRPLSSKTAWRWGAISTAAPRETVVGDSWRLSATPDGVRVLVADGVGHGPLASEAAEGMAGVFDAAPTAALKTLIERGHAALRSTRGAAVAVASSSIGSNTLSYAGVGNISGVLISRGGATRGLMSHNGTVGAEMRSVQELPYEWTGGDRLIMHSDGIMTRWQLGTYSGLGLRHPALMAAILFRDFLRGKDDATVVVLERAS